MFQLSSDEFKALRSQTVTSNNKRGGRRETELVSMQHDTFSRNTRNQLKQVFDALRELMTPPNPLKRPIGFVTPQERS